MACSAHVEKGDVVAVSVAIEQPIDGGWGSGITRGTVLQGSVTGRNCIHSVFFCMDMDVFLVDGFCFILKCRSLSF